MAFQPKFNKNKYSLLINTTSICNLNCYGCSSGCSQYIEKKYYVDLIQLEENLKTIKKVCNIPPVKILLTGGEPLLHPKFLEICKLIKNIFPTLLLIVFTNGLLLNKFSEKEYQELRDLDVIFSMSLYPDQKIYQQIYDNIVNIEKRNIKTASVFDKSRPFFFNTQINTDNLYDTSTFYKCLKKEESFFAIIEDKIFGCDESILLFNHNIPIEEDSYIKISELKNEEQLFSLKNQEHSMCKYCKPKKGSGEGFIIWNTQSKIGFDSFSKNLLDIFLYDYEAYKKLQDDNQRLIEFLNNPIFDYGIMKRNYFDGYPRLRTKYFDGKYDVCIIFDKTSVINENSLKQMKDLLKNQKGFSQSNIYILCNNISLKDQEKIFLEFTSCEGFLNSYLMKSNTIKEGMEYFLNNSFINYCVYLNSNNALISLMDKEFCIKNLKKK